MRREPETPWTVRGLLLSQIAGFVALASIHFGLLMGGYRHPPAGATELVIVASLVGALLLTWGPPVLGQRVATAAQLFASLGALVGLVTMTLGVERATILEVALNLVLLLALTAGLAATRTWQRERTSSIGAVSQAGAAIRSSADQDVVTPPKS
jgi:drug/metabolite transporter (DMT)-like permease